MNRLEQITDVLKTKGPMTSMQISIELGMTEKAVNFHLGMFRRYSKGIRVHSFDMSSPTRKARIYEIGNKPDAKLPQKHRPPSRIAKMRYPGLTKEQLNDMQEKKRLKEIASQIQPFRDPFIAAFFGEARA